MRQNIDPKILTLLGGLLFLSSILIHNLIFSALGVIGIIFLLSGIYQHSKSHKKSVNTDAVYVKVITDLENKLKQENLQISKLSALQKQLTSIAIEYQDRVDIGAERYKIYELQALIFFYQYNNEDALEFLNIAISTKGAHYPFAIELKKQILLEKNSQL